METDSLNHPIPLPPEIEKIIWDADNTFWTWVRYAARAYQETSNHISEKMRIHEHKVAEAMKRYYTQSGTMEDAGLIQGLEYAGFFDGIKGYNRDELIQEVREIFIQARNKYLRTFENIAGVLKTLHIHGKENIVLSDAPGIHATLRLMRSKLAPYISRLYARKSQKINDLPTDVQKKIIEGKYKPPFEVIEIDSEKPDTDLMEVLQLHGNKKGNHEYISRHVALVGDNFPKDMGLAIKWGCLGMYAIWGKANPDDLETIQRFAPDSVIAKNMYIPKPDERICDNPNIIPVTKPTEILYKLGIL
jgi:FMN phosphatase YigB (HAD superfamily)